MRSAAVGLGILVLVVLTGTAQGFLPELDPIKPDNLRQIERLAQLEIPDSQPLQEMGTVAFSPTGDRIAAAGFSRELPVWNMATGELVWQLSDRNRTWVCLDIHPTEPLLIAGSLSGWVTLFDLNTGGVLSSTRTGSSGVHSVHFSPDGTRVVTVNIYDCVTVWDLQQDRSLTQVVRFREHGQRVNYADFSPDGLRVVSGGADNKARVWDADTGEQILEMTDPTRFVEGVQYSPDGTLIAGAADDTLAYLWNADTGERVSSLWGSSGPVNGIAFNHAGTVVAGFTNGYSAIVWSVSSPSTLWRLYGHDGLVLRGAFSPDDRVLASISRDQTVLLWGVPAADSRAD